MMNKLHLGIVMMLFTLLQGCATTAPIYNSSRSEAMNVMVAAFPDGVAERFFKDDEIRHAPSDSSLVNAAAAGAITNAAKTIPGTGIATGVTSMDVGVAVLSSMVSVPADYRLRPQMVIAWMPAKDAESEDAARAKFMETIFANMKDIAKEHGYPIDRVKNDKLPLGPLVREGYSDRCPKVKSKVDGSMFENSVVYLQSESPELVPAPQWISDGKAWRFKAPIGFYAKCLDGNYWGILRDFSSTLPKWAYVYSGLYDPTAKEMQPIKPILFHQGRALRFEKPSTQ